MAYMGPQKEKEKTKAAMIEKEKKSSMGSSLEVYI
jgi:hypothetical protein